MNQEEKDINFSKFRGSLVKKPILKGNEKKYACLTIACTRSYSNENGKTIQDFINLKLWKNPEKIVDELEKGDIIEVDAHTRTGSYTNDKGEKIYTQDLIVDNISYNLTKENDNHKDKPNEMEK